MRWFSLSSLLLLAACGASELQSQRLADGSYTFTCELPMDECVRRAQEQCKNQRYRILDGTSETRLRDAPPFEHAYHTSRLHLMCTNDGASVLLSLDPAKPEKPKPSSTSSCAIGETRTCVGPGACKGGQTCLPDRSGFGSCDCGASAPTPAEPATPPPTAGPGASAAPVGPAPAPSPPTTPPSPLP